MSARRGSAGSARRAFIRRMNTNNADKNREGGAKQVSAKALLRKLNANLSETKMQLDELGTPVPLSAEKSNTEPLTGRRSFDDSGAGGWPATDTGARAAAQRTSDNAWRASYENAVPDKNTTAVPEDGYYGAQTEPAKSRSGTDYGSRSQTNTSDRPGRIVYRFRRTSKKVLQTSPGKGTYVGKDKLSDKKTQAVPRDDAPTKQIDRVDTAAEDQNADVMALMKKYLSEDEYQRYLKRHGEIEQPDTEEFEAAQAEPVAEPAEAGALSEHDRTQIEAETTELSQEDIDIKKRIRDAENYVRSITDNPPPTGHEDEKPGETEFDETDVNLMIAFGMEDELANTLGIDRVNQIEATLARDIVQYDKAAESGERKAKDTFEFTSNDQAKGIFRGYKLAYRKLLLRLLVCVIVMAVAFLYENISVLGGELPAPLDSTVYPVTNIMIDLQLVAICGMLVWRSLAEGTVSLFRMKPMPSSVLSVVMALTLVYDILMCFTGIRPDGIRLYGFPAILCVFLSLLGEYYNLRREILGFNIAASKRVKYAVDRLEPEDAVLETEAFGEYMPESPSIFRVSRANFIDGFYRRTAGYSKNKSIIGAIIPLVVIVSAVFFVAAYYVTKDPVDSLTTAFLVFMMCMPASAFVLYSYPMFKASTAAFELESAIIGEASVDEYTAASAITFDDKDVFPSTGVKVRSVKVYGNNRIDQVIYNAASIFNTAGGSLADVLDIATIDLGHSDDVEILDVEADGLEATVNGAHIYLGRAPYLRRNSFVPVRDADDEEIESSGEISIMYMVVGDEVAAKMYVQYHIDPDFEFMLKQLYGAGVCVGIKTSDPNIDDRMLGMRIKLDKYPVKVLKCRNLNDTNETKPRVDSGIVSKSSVKALLQTLAYCDKVQHITKTNIVIKLFAILIGILLSAFLLALGLSAGVMSFYVALYQLFWILPMIIISKLFIN